MINLKIPRLSRNIKIDGDFFIINTGLLQSNVGTVSPWATAVGI